MALMMFRAVDLAAAVPDGLFVHPARLCSVVSHRVFVVATGLNMSVPAIG
ncbi:MAG: hypothetical protein OJF47_003111 [Nitrospira sp.]|jgi:hypothetical protein|nr:MAG: hypothetical protein OJF47_003111 [Nitrospira sp.]